MFTSVSSKLMMTAMAASSLLKLLRPGTTMLSRSSWAGSPEWNRAKQKMRSEKIITPLTVSGKQKRTSSDVKSSSRSLSFISDGLEMFLQYNCCGKQYLLSGLVYAAVVFKNEKNPNNNLAHGSVSSFYLFYVLLCAKASLSNANII